jgi:hypothetical protein
VPEGLGFAEEVHDVVEVFDWDFGALVMHKAQDFFEAAFLSEFVEVVSDAAKIGEKVLPKDCPDLAFLRVENDIRDVFNLTFVDHEVLASLPVALNHRVVFLHCRTSH